MQLQISTHTSRVGCDRTQCSFFDCPTQFLLTHPVWDVTFPIFSLFTILGFLLTHPVWDVTPVYGLYKLLIKSNFYSHIPCGMWHIVIQNLFSSFHFYSHIPCGMWLETDENRDSLFIISTHTSRVGCDGSDYAVCSFIEISTHTSRVGCDGWRKVNVLPVFDFYSHIPCGMWLLPVQKNVLRYGFLLTHPVWDVTGRG